MQESELVQLAKNGDIEAFEQLVEQYQGKIYNYALRFVKDRDNAFDMAQEVLIKVFKNISSFKGDSKFSTWLYRITYNVCMDYLRKNGKIDTTSIDEEKEDFAKMELTDTSDTPEEALVNKENLGEVYQAISMLPPEYQTAIMLRDVDGYSYEEIASIQKCSIGTVKSRINRGRTKLKEILSEYLEQKHKDKRHNKKKDKNIKK